MNELKAGVLVTPHNEGMCFHRSSAVIAVTEGETEFYLKSEADKVIAHNKHKRCLAMAEICRHEWCVLYYERKKYRENKFLDYLKERKNRHMEKWLELAEKFKEAK